MCYKRNKIIRTTAQCNRAPDKRAQPHDLHSRPEKGQGELQILQHIRKSQSIYIVTAVFEHQRDLFRKRWSLIWSRIQDITSSFIYSRIWHYTTAISLYSAKNLSLQQAMKKKCQKRNINTWKHFHLLPAMVAEGSTRQALTTISPVIAARSTPLPASTCSVG